MATIAEIREQGTDFLIENTPITEPLAAPEPLRAKLKRFGDHYDLSQESHLFRYLVALCGDAGAGSLTRSMLYPRLQNFLDSTNFFDLDRFYGSPLSLPRLGSEIYLNNEQGKVFNPLTEAGTEEQWRDVKIKDAQYRARCLLWMRAIIAGPTMEGMALAGEAATGYECEVFERWKYLENVAQTNPNSVPNIGVTASWNEFVIIPKTTHLDESEKRAITRLVDKLRPVNSLPSIYVAPSNKTDVPIQSTAASSEGFYIKRLVTGRRDITWPELDPAAGHWISQEEREAPTFAFMQQQESITFLTIVSSTSSSEHVGWFNLDQRKLFAHLRNLSDPPIFYVDEFSYAKSFAPITLTIPWIDRG